MLNCGNVFILVNMPWSCSCWPWNRLFREIMRDLFSDYQLRVRRSIPYRRGH